MSKNRKLIFYAPNRWVTVYRLKIEGNRKYMWYIDYKASEIEIFQLYDEEGFEDIEAITKYILETIYEMGIKINNQVLTKLKEIRENK